MSMSIPANVLMDMGHGGSMKGPSCKISMLWNWNTVDSCFLASSWHIKSKGMFIGSVFGIFFLCVAIEAVRRMAREYDRRIVTAAHAQHLDKGETQTVTFQPSWIQHFIRTLMYGSQFSAAFLVMLLGMYYNGYVLIFGIFLGQTVGFLLFGRDTFGNFDGAASGCCC